MCLILYFLRETIEGSICNTYIRYIILPYS